MCLSFYVDELISKISANQFFNEKWNCDSLGEKIYKHQKELQDFAETQAKKIDWSVYDSDAIRRLLIKYSELGNRGCYRNDETANLFNIANDLTVNNTQMMVAFARAVAPVPHGRPLGEQCDLWAYIK